MTRLTLSLGVLGLALLGGCFDEDETEPDAGNCAELTYANFGKALIDAKCVGCHSSALPSGGIRLDTLADIKNASSHIIEHAVELNPPAMPYMQPALPAADRDKLEQWLTCGAP